ncbi:helix-turn-helix domain-containing protein [Mangrovimonas sp. ST2L15]|uniref:helix-turn-helix domain-containing protein n=1 Tax=Mangrovimonas sp. ST2L15 TaxID=1645916 RepID=UPI0006B4B6E6|nr:helix-turn-helix domain-containing protein [Mangrovimonas sp. ST2L15]
MSSKKLHFYQLSPEEFIDDLLLGVDHKLTKLMNALPSEKNNEDDLLTVDETLSFLKCSKQALWNWRKSGILPSYRLGNRVYYKKSDILNKLVKQS